MNTIWITSDTHFHHKLMTETRGFASLEEHDEEIITRWNANVRPGDTVWHLGDVGFGNASAVLGCVERLHGVKHLVTGNHDPCWPGHRRAHAHQRAWLEQFASIQQFARARAGSTPIILSHFPYQGDGDHTDTERHTQFRLPDMGEWLVHGHLHSADRVTGDHSVHAGLDAWGLRPANIDEIRALIHPQADR